jgi:hypothetical protein
MSDAGELGEVQPVNAAGIIDLGFVDLDPQPGSLNYGPIQQVTFPSGQNVSTFKPPQQIQFRLGVANPIVTDPILGDNWLTVINLKFWWGWPNKEFRLAGTPTGRPALEVPAGSGWAPIDQKTFLSGPNGGLANNRYVWTPAAKRLDTTPYDVAPLPVPPQPNSYSELQDDVIRMVLPNPTDAEVIAAFPAPQVISRWVIFWYPAQGMELGVTYSAETSTGDFPIVPKISMQYRVGSMGGSIYTENEG